MKILYVEDELSQNIPRIIQLFGRYLGEERIQLLERLEHDASGYGASPEDIKSLVDATHVVEVEFHFPDALRKILFQHEQYDLFIIDRNLSQSEYTTEEIRRIEPDYNEQLRQDYAEREGDYLFLKLGICSHGEALKKVRFLTAYSNQDEFRRRKEIVPLVKCWRSQIKDFFEKGDPDAIKHLHNDVVNIPQYRAKKERRS